MPQGEHDLTNVMEYTSAGTGMDDREGEGYGCKKLIQPSERVSGNSG